MTRSYKALSLRKLPRGIEFASPSTRAEPPCTWDTLAIELITDFCRVHPVSVLPNTPIDQSNDHMILKGVRSALVTDSDGALLGLISAADIQGEVPVRLQQGRSIPRKDVTVSDVMLPVDQIPAVRLSEVAQARLGDLIQTFREVGRHHVLVVDDAQEGNPSVCGMFSSRDIARALGFELAPSLRATTFVELWKALAS